MLYPKFGARFATKSDIMLGLVAASVVLMSGLAMSKLSAGNPNFAGGGMPHVVGGAGPDIVSQNAIAPSASPDMPAIAAAASPAAPDPSAMPAASNDSCPISLELMDEGNATIGGTLLAPCLPSTDLVVAHAGLVFSAKTLATGALFFSLPALKTDGQVDIRFAGGQTASASVPMPDAAKVQRVAVQWPYADGFAIHAFENGAGFDDPGHIWQGNVNAPAAGEAQKGGYLTTLGDASVEMPLMAQVFTYGSATPTDVVFEVAVTDTNCAGEVQGDALYSTGGAVEKSEISVATPDCDAVGEFVEMGFTPPNPALAMAN